MSIFSKHDREFKREMAKQAEAQKENIRRREFCVDKASWVCDERPGDVIRVAEQMYEWIYGERP
jgi:hypothetical protein